MKNKNEIKKILYKEKPLAKMTDGPDIEQDYYTYRCNSSLGSHLFLIPQKDMGENIFEKEISAQLLIRWLEY